VSLRCGNAVAVPLHRALVISASAKQRRLVSQIHRQFTRFLTPSRHLSDSESTPRYTSAPTVPHIEQVKHSLVYFPELIPRYTITLTAPRYERVTRTRSFPHHYADRLTSDFANHLAQTSTSSVKELHSRLDTDQGAPALSIVQLHHLSDCRSRLHAGSPVDPLFSHTTHFSSMRSTFLPCDPLFFHAIHFSSPPFSQCSTFLPCDPEP
jgi:hypothetical protein